LGVW
jgi:hypothetical protein